MSSADNIRKQFGPRSNQITCWVWSESKLFDTLMVFLKDLSKKSWFTDRSKAVLLLWILYVFFCLVFDMSLCASVYMCFVVTCWERADLLSLVCGVKLWVCHFPIGILGQLWYLIVSIPQWSLHPYLLWNESNDKKHAKLPNM